MKKSSHFYFCFLFLLFFITTESIGQKLLPQTLLKDLTSKILSIKKADQYFNAEILEVFYATGGNYLQIQKEIESIPYSIKNQKLLFMHLYKNFGESVIIDGKVWDRYVRLFSYFSRTLYFDDVTAAYLGKYINDLTFLNINEKTEIKNEHEKLLAKQYTEEKLLDTIFNLKEINSRAYNEYKNLIVSSIFNIIFEKDESKFYSSYPIHIKNEQININVLMRFSFQRDYVLPSSYPDSYWKTQNPKVYVKTLKGIEYYDLISMLPTDKYPIIKYRNSYVKTKAQYDSVDIDISRGECIVQIKKGDLIFKEYEPLNFETKSKISEQIKGYKKGVYKIKYSIGKVDNLYKNEIVIVPY